MSFNDDDDGEEKEEEEEEEEEGSEMKGNTKAAGGVSLECVV